MGLPSEVRAIFHNGGTIRQARDLAMQFKNGQQLVNFFKFIEIFYIEEQLKLGISPEEIKAHIRIEPGFFSRNWSLRKIQSMAEKLQGVKDFVNKAATEPITGEFELDPNRGFGVEIELLCRFSRTEVARILTEAGIPAQRDERTNWNRKNIWKIVTDGSLSPDGMELVSPVLKGQAGLDELIKVCTILKKIKCKIDTSCGLHIHHAVKTQGVQDLRILKNVAKIYTQYKMAFDKMLPRTRRNHGQCQHYESSEIVHLLRKIHIDDINHLERHRAVNLSAYFRHGTVEFRQHSGSIDAEKINKWILITQAVMKRAIELAKTVNDVQKHQFQQNMADELRLKQEIREYIQQRVAKFNDLKQKAA